LLNQQAEKGIPTISGKSKSESKDKEKKHKKHKDKDREKDKEHKKHKHRQKDRSKDKNKDKDKKKEKSGYHDSGGDHLKKHHEKVCLFFLFFNVHIFSISKLYSSCQTMFLMVCNIYDLFQKRKHDGMEESVDVHKNKKSKVHKIFLPFLQQ
jgi:hypothetical protein